MREQILILLAPGEGSNSDRFLKKLVKPAGGSEADCAGNGIDGLVRLLQQPFGFLQTQINQVLLGRNTERLREFFAQNTLREKMMGGDLLDRNRHIIASVYFLQHLLENLFIRCFLQGLRGYRISVEQQQDRFKYDPPQIVGKI